MVLTRHVSHQQGKDATTRHHTTSETSMVDMLFIDSSSPLRSIVIQAKTALPGLPLPATPLASFQSRMHSQNRLLIGSKNTIHVRSLSIAGINTLEYLYGERAEYCTQVECCGGKLLVVMVVQDPAGDLPVIDNELLIAPTTGKEAQGCSQL
ncbi:hypothetical protein CC86DRAFT_180739 [Ophiobolus disseminans]|uniref:Uncharacterized protein n=1 Tax=Ophiobolus disseminans TaxID=1469910 RepID=A0A6A7A9Z1_9PLEO|nr:hypothetical protein CC86DRAFT_180739 [Ophiobolus disseminans]